MSWVIYLIATNLVMRCSREGVILNNYFTIFITSTIQQKVDGTMEIWISHFLCAYF